MTPGNLVKVHTTRIRGADIAPCMKMRKKLPGGVKPASMAMLPFPESGIWQQRQWLRC